MTNPAEKDSIVTYFIVYTFNAHGNTRFASGFFDVTSRIYDNDTLEEARQAVIAQGGSAQYGKDAGRCETIVAFQRKADMEESIQDRLEYLRQELRAERISYGELHELQSLADHIQPGDVELLEAAGVPESPDNEVSS